MEKLNVPCVVQEIETPLGIVRVTDRTGKTIPMHVCRNGVDIDYPIPGTEENLQEVPVPENHYWLMLDENDLEEGELYQIALETDKIRCYEHYDPECGGMALLACQQDCVLGLGVDDPSLYGRLSVPWAARRIPQRMGFVFSVLDELDEKIMFQLTWLKCSEEFPAREYEEAIAYWTL